MTSIKIAGLCTLLALGSLTHAQNNTNELKTAIDRSFSSITNYIDLENFLLKTNLEGNAAYFVNIDTENFNKLMKDNPKVTPEDTKKISSIYIGKTAINLENFFTVHEKKSFPRSIHNL